MDQADALYLKQQRDALLMQVAAIERRLGVASAGKCPHCESKFVLEGKNRCLIDREYEQSSLRG